MGLFSLVPVMNRHIIPPRLTQQNQEPAVGEEHPVTPLPSFEAAVLVHLDAAYTLARYLTRRSDLAEDIVQEAVLRALSSFDKQRSENVRAWLLAIVRNCFLTWYARDRKSSTRSNVENLFQLDVKTAGESDPNTPESVLIEHQENDAVRALIAELPGHIREVLVLRDVQDLSYREIADILDVPIGTVMSRLARARKVFAEAWKRSMQQKTSEGIHRGPVPQL